MIHEQAVVSPDAKIGKDVKIGPFSIIDADVEIADQVEIGPHVVVKGPTTIGPETKISQFCSIGEAPQHLSYKGEPTRLEIGARNVIREFCTLNRGSVEGGGVTRIGDDNFIMAYVHIAHDCRVGDHCIFANNATLAGHVTVGDWAIFAGFTGAHQFCRIGAHAFLGMYSGTNRDVPAYTMIGGQPPAPKGINSEGLKRRDFSADQIRNIRNAYRVVYRSGLKLAEAISELEGLVSEQPELELFVESLTASERGIIR